VTFQSISSFVREAGYSVGLFGARRKKRED